MKMRGTFLLMTATSVLLAAGRPAVLAATNQPPEFTEVYKLLREHLPGATDESLNQAAVAGLVAEFPGQVAIVGEGAAAITNRAADKSRVLDHAVVYLRVSQATDTLAAELAEQLRTASPAPPAGNPPAGRILDLRFCPGDGYGGIKAVVDLLVPAKTPLIVLVNGATMGAAELLAAELHEAGALILGNPTAGLAMTTEDFPLANGQHLRLATTPIKWHGADLGRLQPDIIVKVGLEDERGYLANPYTSTATVDGPQGTDTNSLSSLLDHTSEAELVRQKRKDDGEANPEPPAKTEPVRLVLRDPVLARAVDLVEGLAVVRASHP